MSILRMAQAALLLIAAAICLTVSAPRQAFAADPAINEYALGVTDGKLTVGGADVTEHDLSSTVPKYQAILSAALGILAITMFILTLIQFLKLGGAGDNLMRRRRAINGILASGVATMLLGGLATYVSLLWGILGSAAG